MNDETETPETPKPYVFTPFGIIVIVVLILMIGISYLDNNGLAVGGWVAALAFKVSTILEFKPRKTVD